MLSWHPLPILRWCLAFRGNMLQALTTPVHFNERIFMNDTKISLTLPLVNAVLQYLGTRPYQEVFQIVQAVQEQATPQLPMPEIKPEETVQ